MSSIQWPNLSPATAADDRDPKRLTNRDGWDAASSVPPAYLVLWVVIVTVTMLFAGFISAYLIRRTSGDWTPIYSPPLLLVNTAVIVASSAALEIARVKSNRRTSWTLIGTGLGAVFIAGQLQVWRQLASTGIFLPSSPHGSFFFMLSSVHAAHVFAGVLALLYTSRKSVLRQREDATLTMRMATTYWHFVTSVWIVLYVLLFVWD